MRHHRLAQWLGVRRKEWGCFELPFHDANQHFMFVTFSSTPGRVSCQQLVYEAGKRPPISLNPVSLMSRGRDLVECEAFKMHAHHARSRCIARRDRAVLQLNGHYKVLNTCFSGVFIQNLWWKVVWGSDARITLSVGFQFLREAKVSHLEYGNVNKKQFQQLPSDKLSRIKSKSLQ